MRMALFNNIVLHFSSKFICKNFLKRKRPSSAAIEAANGPLPKMDDQMLRKRSGRSSHSWHSNNGKTLSLLCCWTSLISGLGISLKKLKEEDDESAKKNASFSYTPEFLEKMPVEEAKLVVPPDVPPPIKRRHPARLIVKLNADVTTLQMTRERKFRGWAFNRTVPGPFIRARKGDILEVQFTNLDVDGIGHNIDFHTVCGPGGGSSLLFAEKDETKVATFRLLYPGLYVYHCAAAPIPMHIANGMYGLLLVEPEEGLPSVDKEFYVMQSEFYAEASLDTEEQADMMEYSYSNGLSEMPQAIVFNGREGALTDRPLLAKTGQRVRIFFGNAGPNLTSSFHVIGQIFDVVYRDGGLMDAPCHGLQTQSVPPGGATIVEMETLVPGTFTLVDHAIHRIDKGAIGFLKVAGPPRDDIFSGQSAPSPCPGCKLHE